MFEIHKSALAGLGCATMLACGGSIPPEATSTSTAETLWCFQVPVDTLLVDADPIAQERLTRSNVDETAIHCAAERPAAAEGDALLPIRLDREARTLVLEGGLNVSAEAIIVRIDGLDAGTWTEHKRVYNLSDRPWNGWQVTMGNADLVVPATASPLGGWTRVDDVANVVYPEGFFASVDASLNAVYFGASEGPSDQQDVLVEPGTYIDKTWQFTVTADAGPRGILMSHTRADVLPVAEAFQYSPGPLAGRVGGEGFADAWTNVGGALASVIAGGLAYPAGTFEIQSSGGAIQTSSPFVGQGAFRRALSRTVGDTGGPKGMWFSALLQPGGGAGTAGVRLIGSSGAKLHLGWVDAGNQRVWALDTIGGGAGCVSNASIAASGGPTLLVGHVLFSGDGAPDSLHLFLNPGSQTPSPAQAVAACAGVNLGDITHVGVAWSQAATIDEIRIGSTYAALSN